MTFYRHFCERDDFEISVITDEPLVMNYNVPYRYHILQRNKYWKRLSSTRFHFYLQTWDKLYGSIIIPQVIRQEVKRFKPDAIFTVAGSWNRMAVIAEKVARKYNIPLIGSFNDWWYYSSAFLPSSAEKIEKKFRDFYTNCDLAICTSEGMQDELGPHPNSIVLYPIGAKLDDSFVPEAEEISDRNSAFTIAFGGSLADWYGKMLESIITSMPDPDIRFKVFGSNPSWTSGFDKLVKEQGIYSGQVSFDQLKSEMAKVDALILLMGFDSEIAQIERTSFKTKFLDYLTFRKPILLWGPEYCSAVKTAREFLSAEICTVNDPEQFIKVLYKVKEDTMLQEELVRNALTMYRERFNPDLLHAKLRQKIYDLKAME